METIEIKIREIAKELLSSGRIKLMIGFENGTLPFRARPVFIREAPDAGRLVWNSWCANNLAVYLPGLFEPKKHKKNEAPPPPPKVGIIAKSCDVRSVINLVREHQLPRQNVVIVGVPCAGMVDVAKINALLDEDTAAAVEDDGTTVSITGHLRSGSKKVQGMTSSSIPALNAALRCRKELTFPFLERRGVFPRTNTAG